ncbi:MAG: OmpA family protein, partial [Algoriphagus sp.]|nr:OmpA family protein [Algoriphagus sp.]
MKTLNQVILKASSAMLLAFCISAAYSQQLRSLSGANSPNDDTNPVWVGNNTLFFTRAFHPKNIGGKADPGDIWMTKKDPNGVWSEATHRPDLSSAGYDLVLGLEDVLTLLVLRIENNGKTVQQYSKFGQEWNFLRTVNFPGLNEFEGMVSGRVVQGGKLFFLAGKKSGGFGNEDIYFSEKT